mgnify:CR=1 FL=1
MKPHEPITLREVYQARDTKLNRQVALNMGGQRSGGPLIRLVPRTGAISQGEFYLLPCLERWFRGSPRPDA